MKRVILMMMLAMVILAGNAQAGGMSHDRSIDVLSNDCGNIQGYLNSIKKKLDSYPSIPSKVGFVKAFNEINGSNLTPAGNGTINYIADGSFSECTVKNWVLISDKTTLSNTKDVAYTTFQEGNIFKVKVENTATGHYIYYKLSKEMMVVLDASLPFSADSSAQVNSPTLMRKLNDNRTLSNLLTKYYQGWSDFTTGTYSAYMTLLLRDQGMRSEFLGWAAKHITD